MRISFLLAATCHMVLALTSVAGQPKATSKPADTRPAGGKTDLYARIVDGYMKGNWDDLDKALAAPAGELTALSAPQRADVDYVREALAECRPAWWKECKAGKKLQVRPSIFGRTPLLNYDPAAKNTTEMSFGPGGMTLGVQWDPATMDDPGPGAYGFLKRDQAMVDIWSRIGMALAWTNVRPETLANMTEKDKMRLNRYLDFRGNVTALGYSTPPGRRYALDIFLSSFMEQYGQGPIAGSRRAVGAMLLGEILANPKKYPTLKLPSTLEAQDAEAKLGAHFKMAISSGTVWTIAEDRAYREALKGFATANDTTVLETEKITLPSKLTVAIDPTEDAPLKAKRDAWVKAQFDKQ